MLYEDFYRLIWGHYITENDVSLEYRERNIDFIKQITFSLWRKAQSKNIHEFVCGDFLKMFFTNLFLYNPENFDC